MTKLTSVLSAGMIVVLAAGGCASSSGAAKGAASAVGQSALSATAGKLGIKETLIQVALQAAQAFLSKSSATPTVADKEQAAQAGVNAAVDQAKAEGQELTQPQQSGLLDALKGLL